MHKLSFFIFFNFEVELSSPGGVPHDEMLIYQEIRKEAIALHSALYSGEEEDDNGLIDGSHTQHYNEGNMNGTRSAPSQETNHAQPSWQPTQAQGYNHEPSQGYSPTQNQNYAPGPTQTQQYAPGPAQNYNPGPTQGYAPGPTQSQGYAPQSQTQSQGYPQPENHNQWGPNSAPSNARTSGQVGGVWGTSGFQGPPPQRTFTF